MNDDDPKEVLAGLKAEHRRLDERIKALQALDESDQLEIARLKKQKLRLKDEIESVADDSIPDIIA